MYRYGTEACRSHEKRSICYIKKLIALILNSFSLLANQKVPSLREVDQKQSQTTSALIPEEDHTEDEVTLTHFSDVEEENFKPRESIYIRKSASTTAQREYAAAMKVIGSSSIRRSGGNIVGPSKRSRNQPALLLEDEIEDDWLENDLRSPVKKSSKKTSSSRNSSEFDSERTPTASSSRLKRYLLNNANE